ncbi:MAG TPA: alanine/glycine:cation symporter family protein [Sandaracinaceae bacterium LLY-WYZ-13_1]|nr:alanine/glycine:cation symporter family protein [Sandaracinaceae bacterium LLY-WYZ-13_1]
MTRPLPFACAFVAASLLCAPAAAQEAPEEDPPAVEAPGAAAAEEEPTPLDALDAAFGAYVVTPLEAVFFFDLVFWDNHDARLNDWPGALRWIGQGGIAEEKGLEVPFIVLWLVLGALFFTLRMGFINVRGFRHAVEVTAGKYDDPEEEGEVSHFQALASALSATVGLGNIAGVALAVSLGGPGAVVWMVVAGFLGMSTKFVECTLGQLYRKVDERGRVLGGPMRYLRVGLEGLGRPTLGKLLSVLFALMCIGGSFGGGNMFQSNQAFAQTARVIPWFEDKPWLFGILVAIIVGLVIIGGIRRIGQVAGAIVPMMCAVYVIAGVAILVTHAAGVPAAFGKMFGEAFSLDAGVGGLLGVLVTGFKRSAFSNEAGVGSAAIAHSAAATSEPVREGLVASLGPFIDTIVICTMTGLVVVVSGAYLNVPEEADSTARGVLMTSAAFESVFPWFPYLLAVAVFLFALSTMISWSYYGERCWVFLFGDGASMIYRVIFLCFVVLGAILKLGSVVGFSDLMILGMAFPNILGVLLLHRQVAERLAEYWGRYTSGRMTVPARKAAEPPAE